MKSMAAPTIAGLFGLAGFSVAVIAGLAAGNPASMVLWRAILAMIFCYPIGLGIGFIAQKVVQDHIEAHRNANPTEDVRVDDEPPIASSKSKEGDDEILVV